MSKNGFTKAVSILIVCLIITSHLLVFTIVASAASVPFFSQRDTRWKDDLVGSSGKTIEEIGCAMTCTAMLLNYYGQNTDPKILNAWLSANGGYTPDGAIYWAKPAEYSNYKMQFVSMGGSISDNDNWSVLDNELSQGYPVIVEVDAYPSTPTLESHWVLVVSKEGNQYYINDPWDLTPSSKLISTYYDATYDNTFFKWRVYHGSVPSPDTTIPTVTSFSVTPATVTLGNSFTITFSATDSGGSGLKQVELWRANDSGGSPGTWSQISMRSVSGNYYSGSFSNAPTSGGSYWYGVHAVDNANNWATEPTPVKVTVTTPDTNNPIITAFLVTPTTTTLGNAFTISFSVTDSGGSGLKQVELWRANDYGGSPGTWSQISMRSVSGNYYSGSFLNAPTSGGSYWYGVHAVDNANNWAPESTPEKVTVTTPDTTIPAPLITSPGTSYEPGPVLSTLTPTLYWSTVNGADYYALAISKYPYGSDNIIYNPQHLTGTYHLVPSGTLLTGERYRWNMQAHNSAGWSTVSNTLYFQTLTPTPSEVVTFPDPNLEAAVREAIGKPTEDIYCSDLAELKELRAMNRNISDISGLEYCVNLERLDLGVNQISDISALSNLTNLTQLYLTTNQIREIAPLSNLRSLRTLFLDWNWQIADISYLSNLTNLTGLYLESNQINDISPLSNLGNLTQLGLGGNEISDISALSNLINLTWLDISRNSISDLSPISDLVNLTNLFAANNHIIDVSVLSRLTEMTIIFLDNNQIVDISSLSGLTRLGESTNLQEREGKLLCLGLQNNQIHNIAPLVENQGLAEGDGIDLRDNILSADSLNIYIPQLEARGVTVYYSIPPPDTTSSSVIPVLIEDKLEIGSWIDTQYVSIWTDNSNLYITIENAGERPGNCRFDGHIWIDTDGNESANYDLSYQLGDTVSLVRLDGIPTPRLLQASTAGGVVNVAVSLSDIGNPSEIAIQIETINVAINGDLTGTYTQGQSSKSISIDGNPSDWNGIQPIATDSRASMEPSYFDINHIYAADDGQRLYIMVDTAAEALKTISNQGILQNPVNIYFDVDKNSATGGFHGAEYVVYIANDYSFVYNEGRDEQRIVVRKWDGNFYEDMTAETQAALDIVFEFSINLAALGINSNQSIDVIVNRYGVFCDFIPERSPEPWIEYEIASSPPVETTETVTTSAVPVGPSSGEVGQHLTFSTGGASSSLGHSLEYRFDWGDGSYSSWSSSSSASHSWLSQDTYTIRAQARCASHTSVVSAWSNSKSVIINRAQELTTEPNINTIAQLIEQETREKTTIIVDGEEYYIVTLERYIDPETWEVSEYSFFAEEPPSWIIYTDPNFQPIHDEELLRKIWTVDRANRLLGRIGSAEGIQADIETIENLINANEGLADADWVAIHAKLVTFMTVDLAIFAEIGLPISDYDILTILSEEIGHYTDPVRFEMATGRAVLELSKANYQKAQQIAESHFGGISDYNTAKDYLDHYYEGYLQLQLGVALALPAERILESPLQTIASWIPDYINHLGHKVVSLVSVWHKTASTITQVAGIAKDINTAIDYQIELSLYIDNKLKEIPENISTMFEHEKFPIDYTLALLNQNAESLYDKWGIHGVDELNLNLCSPAELHVYDSNGRTTGLVDGEVMLEIPDSYYSYQSHSITIFFPNDSYVIVIKGTDKGNYGLEVSFVENGEESDFMATGIPTASGTVHQYTINWEALSQGGEAVSVRIDADGDGKFEQTITTDAAFDEKDYASSSKGFNWQLLIGVIVGVIVIGGGIYLIARFL